MMQALVFDLGGTHLRSGLLDERGAVRQVTKQRIPSVATRTSQRDVWDGVLVAMLEYERANSHRLPPHAPIAVAFPGPIAGRRIIVQAPTLTGPEAVLPDLAGELEQATGRRVYLLNDVSAAAWHFTAHTKATRFMVVTVSSGVGSKIVDRQHPAQVLDEPAHAGEIGHFVVDDRLDAPVCECGGRGHLGAIASGRGIERAARRRAADDPGGFSRSLLRGVVDPANLANEAHVVPAALAGDGWMLEVIGECTRPLSRTLLGTHMAVGLERIFLIGGFAQALGEVYSRIVRSQMTEMSRYAGVDGKIASLVQLVAPHHEPCLEGCSEFLRGSSVRQSIVGWTDPPVRLTDSLEAVPEPWPPTATMSGRTT